MEVKINLKMNEMVAKEQPNEKERELNEAFKKLVEQVTSTKKSKGEKKPSVKNWTKYRRMYHILENSIENKRLSRQFSKIYDRLVAQLVNNDKDREILHDVYLKLTTTRPFYNELNLYSTSVNLFFKLKKSYELDDKSSAKLYEEYFLDMKMQNKEQELNMSFSSNLCFFMIKQTA